MTVHRLRDPEEVARRASAAIEEAAHAAIAQRGTFSILLAGGDTPRRTYERLATGSSLDGSKVEWFQGDERPVPPEHPDSNYRMIRTALLDPLRVDPNRVHRIPAERSDLAAVALAYEQELARVAGGAPGGSAPQLDLALQGMGADGHTASLFPHTKALSEAQHWFAANEVPALSATRITATFALLERARAVFFLVTGESKAAALADVLEGTWDPELLPSQRLRAHAGVEWFIDAAAAGRLRDRRA
jgi:6-phosphogluconolactonase